MAAMRILWQFGASVTHVVGVASKHNASTRCDTDKKVGGNRQLGAVDSDLQVRVWEVIISMAESFKERLTDLVCNFQHLYDNTLSMYFRQLS